MPACYVIRDYEKIEDLAGIGMKESYAKEIIRRAPIDYKDYILRAENALTRDLENGKVTLTRGIKEGIL